MPKKSEKPKRELTKRQLSRWQQQKRRQRIILVAGLFVIVAVLASVGVGWFTSEYQPLHKTAIKVNDTEFDMNYYIKMLKLSGQGQPQQYIQFMADGVINLIEQNELIRQAAAQLGFTASNDEIEKELKNHDPPLSNDYKDLVRVEILSQKLQDEYFDKQVPQSAEQRYIRAMFLESESQAAGIRAKLKAGEDFAELASKYSLESLSKSKGGDFGWRPQGVLTVLLGTSVPEDYAFATEKGTLSQPRPDAEQTKRLGYWLIKVVEQKKETDEAHVQAILLGSAEEAQKVRARLNSGEDFATVAKEVSQHSISKESGGDLGWLRSGYRSPGFEQFAFNPEVKIGMISEPTPDTTVTTKGGYWLVEVSDIESDRKIEGENRDVLKNKALQEWAALLWLNPENNVDHSYLTDQMKAWAIQRAMED